MTLFTMIIDDYIRALCIGARHSGMIDVIDMYTSSLPRDRMIGWHSEVERDIERINVLLSEYPDYVIGGVV